MLSYRSWGSWHMKQDHKPFGKPDAAKKGPNDLYDTIDVGDYMPSFSLHNDPTVVRILIGRKGTGKTHALKLLEQASKRKGHRTLLRNLDVDLTRYRSVPNVAGNGARSVDWEPIWRFALASAALSRFTCREPDDSAAKALDAASYTRESLIEEWRGFHFDSQSTLDPIGVVIDLLSSSGNSMTLANRVTDPRMEDLERFISGLMRRTGPIHYLLDGFDEFEEGKPGVWLDIQLGLFWLAFRLNTTRTHLRQVFLTVAVRESVLVAASQSQHADRFDFGESMMLLTWSKEAARVFLRSLLSKIKAKPFWKSRRIGDREPEVDWLGIASINLNRPKTEPLIDYLVRHTRCTPRDLISVGNQLASTMNHATPEERCDPRTIDRAMRIVCEDIATKALRGAAEDLMRDARFVRIDELSDDQKRQAALEFVRQLLIKLIERVGAEVSEHNDFRSCTQEILTDMLDEPPEQAHVDAVLLALWRNGLIGYLAGKQSDRIWSYIWSNPNKPEMDGPRSGSKIGFHPALFDLVKLRRSRLGPVY